MERAVIRVDGYVQGVGFRWWTMALGRQLGLTGYVRNLLDGRVETDAQGSPAALRTLIRALIEQPTRRHRPGQVTSHTVDWLTPDPAVRGFIVR